MITRILVAWGILTLAAFLLAWLQAREDRVAINSSEPVLPEPGSEALPTYYAWPAVTCDEQPSHPSGGLWSALASADFTVSFNWPWPRGPPRSCRRDLSAPSFNPLASIRRLSTQWYQGEYHSAIRWPG